MVQNHGTFVGLFGKHEGPLALVGSNLLEGGVIVDGTSNLRIAGNHMGRPLELGQSPNLEWEHRNVEFSGNLVETDYQLNFVHGNLRNFRAWYNTVTNGFGFSAEGAQVSMVKEFDVHHNNILGGVGEWQRGDRVYRPYAVFLGGQPRQTVDLSENWWGTPNAQEVADYIWDQHLDPNEGRIVYEPVLQRPDPHGFVRGRVFDAVTGRPIAGALVRAGELVTKTSVDGYFVMALASGLHDLEFRAQGYEPVTISGTTVAAASVTHVEVGLKARA